MVEVMELVGSRLGDFETLISAEARALYRVAFWILRDEQEAEDAVQETLERAWRSWASVRDEDHRAAWLRKTCVNRCLTLRRRLLLRRHEELETDREPPWLPEAGERAADLHRALPRLSIRQRTVVILHYRFGYSLDECAGLLGTSPGTVRTHLARGLARLRKELGDA